jgi:hypothetical protein
MRRRLTPNFGQSASDAQPAPERDAFEGGEIFDN